MIILEPKKQAAAIIQSSFDSSGVGKEESSELSGVAEDILSAVKSGSAQDLAVALKAFLAECESSESEG